jgi:hypothetical protein
VRLRREELGSVTVYDGSKGRLRSADELNLAIEDVIKEKLGGRRHLWIEPWYHDDLSLVHTMIIHEAFYKLRRVYHGGID